MLKTAVTSLFNSTGSPQALENLAGRYPVFLSQWEEQERFYSDKVPDRLIDRRRPALVVFSREFPGIALASVFGVPEQYALEAEKYAKRLLGTCYSPKFSAVFWKASKAFSESPLPEPTELLLAAYSEESAHSLLSPLDSALGDAREEDIISNKPGTFGEVYSFLRLNSLRRESNPGRFRSCEPRAAFGVVSTGRGPSIYRLEENLGVYERILSGKATREDLGKLDPHLAESDLIEHIGQDALLSRYQRTGEMPIHLLTAPSSELSIACLSEKLPEGIGTALEKARTAYRD